MQVFTYEIVGELPGGPLASNVYPTIIVSAQQFETSALATHRTNRPPDADPDEWDEAFRSPLDRYRRLLVSQRDESTITAFLADADIAIDVGDVVTIGEVRDSVANRAARWTFDYIGVLAAVAGLPRSARCSSISPSGVPPRAVERDGGQDGTATASRRGPP